VQRPAGTVLRLDFSAMPSGGTVTPQGFYRFDASLGRAGVMKYLNADGTVRRELRPPDEVFSRPTMESAWAAVVTDGHPPVADAFVHPGNVKQYSIGHGGDAVRRDGMHVRGNLVVEDGEVVALIAKGDRKEISPGYLCRTDTTPGRWNGKEYGPNVQDGEAYDCVQRDIVYNHIALLPPGRGRQGASVCLALDSIDGSCAVMLVPEAHLGDFIKQQMLIKGMSLIDLAVASGILKPADVDHEGNDVDPLLRREPTHMRTMILQDIISGYIDRPSDEQLEAIAGALDVPMDSLIQRLPLELQKLDSGDEPRSQPRQLTLETQPMAIESLTLKLDGVDVEVPKAVAPLVQRALADRDTKITTLEGAAAKHATDLSTVQARLDSATTELTKAQADLAAAPTKLRAELQARAKLEGEARSVLGEAFKLDDASDRAIREAVIKQYAPELVLDGKDETYVAVSYDHAIAKLPKQDASSRTFGAAFPTGPARQVLDSAGSERETDPLFERQQMIDRNQNAGRSKASA
jgi:hypothetical protein